MVLGATALCIAVTAAAAPKKPAVSAVKTAPAPKPKLTAAQVLDGYVKATGGKEAYRGLKNALMDAQCSYPSLGLSGTAVIKAKAPDKYLAAYRYSNGFEARQGYDGKEAWRWSSRDGVATVTAGERALMAFSARIDVGADWRSVYNKAEMLRLQKSGSGWEYVIRMHAPDLPAQTCYYDSKSLLLNGWI